MGISNMLGATMVAGAPSPKAGPEPAGSGQRPPQGRSRRPVPQAIWSTLRMPSWASISSKPRFTSASGMR